MNKIILKIIYTILGIVTLSSCVRLEKQIVNYLTIYNLENASSIEIPLDLMNDKYSKINTELEDGTEINGDLLLSNDPIRIPSNIKYNEQILLAAEEIQKADSIFIDRENRNKNTFPELFGFSKNTQASPQGSATILIGAERVLQIIFYQVDRLNQFASGIGIDNKDNIYRVYLRTEIYYK